MRAFTVFGTRPEAIKMAPVINALSSEEGVENFVCLTGQHADMVKPVMDIFGISANYDLSIMRAGQGLTHITCAVLSGLESLLNQLRPSCVLVHGDTSTSMAAALAAFYAGIPVAHVEAGLRTRNLKSPWPEEANRQITGRLARLHFAPTETARENLIAESVREEWVHVTGNTVIDALFSARELTLSDAFGSEVTNRFGWLDQSKKLVLVTGHRRENFAGGLEDICHALLCLAKRTDIEIIYPLHMNPVVRTTAREILGNRDNIHLVEPLDYLSFVWLMDRAKLILTDSGGIQEEAPSFGKPVLVTRDTTERPEALCAGTVKLIGTNKNRIIQEVSRLLDNSLEYQRMSRAINPYGDGLASSRIVTKLVEEFR